MPYGLDEGMQYDFQQPDEGPLQPSDPIMGMQQQSPYPDFSQQSYANPREGLSPVQETLDAEYHAAMGTEAQHKLAELDKAAKFRRALGMLTETFATITGRPDIAAQARQQMVLEDKARADQVHAQILSHVGLRAIEKERVQKEEEAKKTMDALYQKSTASALEVHKTGAAFVKGPNGEILPAPLSVLEQGILAQMSGKEPPVPFFIDPAEGEKRQRAVTDPLDADKVRTEAGIRQAAETAGAIDRATNKQIRDARLEDAKALENVKVEAAANRASQVKDAKQNAKDLPGYVRFKTTLTGLNLTDEERTQHLLSLKADLVAKERAKPGSVDKGVLRQLREDLVALGVK